MSARRQTLVAACGMAALLGGCSSEATGNDSVATQSSVTASSPVSSAVTTTSALMAVSPLTIVPITEEVSVPSPDLESSMQALVDQAITDLAGRLGTDASNIVALTANAVSWPDKSLGCPQPGMVYNQVIVDGALIKLTAGGTTYNYHSGGSRSPFLCEKS